MSMIPVARHGLLVHGAAAGLLALMATLMLLSIRDDVITMDEQPHIGAGYSYLSRADYRMNPEHPPLMKDLAAFPLLFMHLKVPWGHHSWRSRDQWGFGGTVMYRSGRDPDDVTWAAKVPMILATLALGAGIYAWTRKAFGGGAALAALFLYAFSPTFLAHGRLVTNDVGAAIGIFAATVCHLRFLQSPSRRNTVLAGVALGLALLTKFSAVLLVPTLGVLTVAWVAWSRSTRKLSPLRYLALTACVLGIAALVVYGVYLHHTWHFPNSAGDVIDPSSPGPTTSLRALAARALDSPVLRPWGYYLFGLQWQLRHLTKLGRPFLHGKLLDTLTWSYFPTIYLIKEPLALHVLTLAVILFALSCLRRRSGTGGGPSDHFSMLALLFIVGVYWIVSIHVPRRLGVRHVLPTFPFIYVLVGGGLAAMAARMRTRAAATSFAVAVALLLAWQAATVIRVHPSYLAYFNELAGGPDGGLEAAGDSNLDWGQDLKRLARFVDERGIPEIHLDYFGTALPGPYFKAKTTRIQDCEEPRRGWVAVSAYRYQQSRWRPECDYRRWLGKDSLVAKIGYSILVFRVD